jgi:MoxR-like ATPase
MGEQAQVSRPTLGDVEQILAALAQEGYIADREIATAIYLSIELHKPLLVEGAAGVGKTEIAKVMARALGTDLIRLQCYEGLDVNTALYEWNYQKQMLRIRLEEGSGRSPEEKEQTIFSEPFLLRRPLLQAITHPKAPVLLVDEIDRVDEEFEAFLLELLSDWQITIPEIGTIRAAAACTCGSVTPASRRSWPSSCARSPASRASWRSRSRPSCTRCGPWTSRRSPGWRRPWTGARL